VIARPLSPDDLALVESLLDAYPFKAYRNYRVFPRRAQAAVMRAEISDTLAHRDGFVLHVQDGASNAFAVGRALEWDSRFFGVPMGRIEYLLSSDIRLLVLALHAAIDALRARGVRHVSARVDVADIEQVAILEAGHFRLMDSLVTYTTRPRKEPPNPVREVGCIREFRPEDAAELLCIAEEAYKAFRGRFHLDPHIPNDRCDAFYLEWAKQTVNRTMADMILVSEGADGRLLGFLGFRRREPVSSVGGVAVFGGGLGACRADTPGAYAGLIRAGTIWAHEHNGVAECQTQNYNFPTVRIYEAVGAHYVRAEYTLHCWLSE
jgi:hypothetical protein